MALDTKTGIAPYDAPEKDLYEVGEMPPLGYVPKKMYAWAIRRERHGEPDVSFQKEVVDVWDIDSQEVLVLVMAAGVNYNGVWAGLGQPISPFDVHGQDYHIAGSDASGIVWKVGDKVKRWKVGDEVVIHCNQDDGDDEDCNGGDPMFSPTQRIWGYETGDGSFAQFTRVQAQQLMPRPKHLTWEESACYTLTLATAYRMLFGHAPHDLKPGQNVLVWGASGGLGSYAIQLANTAGANAIGEATFPVSSLVCKKGGMVVICAGTSGFNCTFDVRYMWMHQKRLQGSHFAHLKQAAAANKLMVERRLDPCMSEVFPWDEIPQAHVKMLRNEHKPGNMAVLVQAPRTGLRTVEDVLDAGR